MAPADLANAEGCTSRKEHTAKTSTFATAKFASIHEDLVLERRELHGVLRLAFAKDLRNMCYR